MTVLVGKVVDASLYEPPQTNDTHSYHSSCYQTILFHIPFHFRFQSGAMIHIISFPYIGKIPIPQDIFPIPLKKNSRIFYFSQIQKYLQLRGDDVIFL
jgi:hypothetical protein